MRKKNRCIILAEAGVNHNGSLLIAEKLIKEAKLNGADIIKFQTYKADRLVVKESPRFWDWSGERKKNGTQYDSYSKLDKFGSKDYKILKKLCDKYKIEFMSTPFDIEASNFLYKIGMRKFKIASCDITNFPLIENIAKKKVQIFLSTGASNISEINKAVKLIEKFNKKKIVIMHCTLCYPTRPQDANLFAIKQLSSKFPNHLMGFSDHTLGILAPTLSVSLGVKYIEKHFTINKNLKKSADHWLSINPKELKKLRQSVDEATISLGIPKKHVLKCENISRKNARRSIVFSKNLDKNHKIKFSDLDFKRPGIGISPSNYKRFIGKKLIRAVKFDEFIKDNDIK